MFQVSYLECFRQIRVIWGEDIAKNGAGWVALSMCADRQIQYIQYIH